MYGYHLQGELINS